MKVVWSPTARARAIAAVDYIAEDRPGAALEWLDGMVSRVEMLSELPEQGRVVPEWNEPAVREIMYDPYRVIYEVSEDRVEILTLSHQRQQLPTARDKG
ncbi:MAG: type II toxin-antitoxin system RelE/ParE family toxin [Gemmatimonadales bacterium]|nr:MAG: type II toxin-antitoxin system RelE/ParE family toxin [Gemmatimonadales bacterium]